MLEFGHDFFILWHFSAIFRCFICLCPRQVFVK